MIKYLKAEPNYNITELNQQAIYQYGKHQRIDKAIEELVELAHVLTKLRKLPSTCLNPRSDMFHEHFKPLMEEMADVTIMIECLLNTFELSVGQLDVEVVEKLEKFRHHLKRDETPYR